MWGDRGPQLKCVGTSSLAATHDGAAAECGIGQGQDDSLGGRLKMKPLPNP